MLCVWLQLGIVPVVQMESKGNYEAEPQSHADGQAAGPAIMEQLCCSCRYSRDGAAPDALRVAAAGVVRAVAQAGGAGLWANAGAGYEDAVRVCCTALGSSGRAVRDAFAAALGDMAAAAGSISAQEAVSAHGLCAALIMVHPVTQSSAVGAHGQTHPHPGGGESRVLCALATMQTGLSMLAAAHLSQCPQGDMCGARST